MRILIVRAAEDARRTARRLEAAGHQAILAPVVAIHPLEFTPRGEFDAVLATSAHAFERPQTLASLCALPIFVVGARTAEAAQAAGFAPPRVVAANAEDLSCALRASAPPAARLLYLAGRDRKPDLEAALQDAFTLTVAETYEARPMAALPGAAQAALAAGAVDAVLHYSRRSAAIFLALARRADLADRLAAPRHVAISPDAAKPLAEAGLPLAIAAAPTEDSMIEQLARLD